MSIARTLAVVSATWTVALPSVALAGPAWSSDGSKEAQTLRMRARGGAVEGPIVAEDTRGMEYIKGPTDPGAPQASPPPPPENVLPPAPEQPADDFQIFFREEDFRRSYEMERIAKRGRSFFVPGVVLTTLGTILVIGAIAGIAEEANPITGGLLGGSLAMSAVGWPLLVVGVRMRKHPERFLKARHTASVAPGGLTLRF